MVGQVRELTASECLALLRTAPVGRVAMTAADDEIDVFPINFVVDQGTVVFRTALGTKLTTIADRPRVTFEADCLRTDGGASWSVMVKGNAERVTGRDDLIELFDVEVFPAHPDPKPYFVRIEPSSVTGRSFTSPTPKF